MNLRGVRSRRLRFLMVAQRGICFYCPRKMVPGHPGGLAPTIDHKRPRWCGGRNDVSNVVAACKRCNTAKGALDAETFIRLRAARDGQALVMARRHAEAAARAAARGGWVDMDDASGEGPAGLALVQASEPG